MKDKYESFTSTPSFTPSAPVTAPAPEEFTPGMKARLELLKEKQKSTPELIIEDEKIEIALYEKIRDASKVK